MKSNVIIIGGGLGGITAALELLDAGLSIILVDRDEEKNFGGLAKESFGGIFFVNSPKQRKIGIRDSPELALEDWYSFAEFENGDVLPKKWAESYVNNCTSKVYHWLKNQGIGFFPMVHWVERGMFVPGNSVPRFHMVWGTGHELAVRLINNLKKHPNADKLTIFFQHRVTGLLYNHEKVFGISCLDEKTGTELEIEAETTIIASGGIGGSIDAIKKHWYKGWGSPPEKILNGGHRYGIGDLHWEVLKLSANVTHLEKMWNYAAGIHHPYPKRDNHGLSVVPPKSALWINAKGERIGPNPLVSGYDTRYLVEKVCEQEHQYSWQVMNWKIAKKEIAVSGSEFNDAIREKRWFGFMRMILFGNMSLLNALKNDCVDFVMAESVDELAERMNALNKNQLVNPAILRKTINQYDQQIERGPKYFNDEQLRRISHLRSYPGDRIRTCKFQKIDDQKAYPLIALREFILSRKSLGGIQTDLDCQVLRGDGSTIRGLLAVGEAAGFGGGGIHGLRALEGTFLGSCIYTGRIAAGTIKNKKL